MRWFKAERLTSGVRDVNRIETVCVAGAGCAITWQEDPEGLRRGQGEGPGEGWSGAVANSETDVWYSYIDFEHFDVVQNPADDDGCHAHDVGGLRGGGRRSDDHPEAQALRALRDADAPDRQRQVQRREPEALLLSARR